MRSCSAMVLQSPAEKIMSRASPSHNFLHAALSPFKLLDSYAREEKLGFSVSDSFSYGLIISYLHLFSREHQPQ